VVPWAHPSPELKRHHDRLSRFCRAHCCDRTTDRPTDHATPVTTGRIYEFVHSTAMRPKINATRNFNACIIIATPKRQFPEQNTSCDVHIVTYQFSTAAHHLPNPQNRTLYNAFQSAKHPQSAPSRGGIYTVSQKSSHLKLSVTLVKS